MNSYIMFWLKTVLAQKTSAFGEKDREKVLTSKYLARLKLKRQKKRDGVKKNMAQTEKKHPLNTFD